MPRKSDATFWRDGTGAERGYFSPARPGWWALAAGWKRAAITTAAACAFLCYARWPGPTGVTLALAAAAAGGYGAVRAARAWNARAHRRRVIRPAAAALAPKLGAPARAVEQLLELARDPQDAAGGARIGQLTPPDHWAATPTAKTEVEQVFSARIGVDVDYRWPRTPRPVLYLVRAATPPAEVLFADVRAHMEACPPARTLLGATAKAGEMRYWDTGSEDPHIAGNVNTRRGKTTFLLCQAAQVIRNGGHVVAIDPKRKSFLDLAGVPGFELYNDPRNVPGMWHGVKVFRKEMDRRYIKLAADPTAEFNRWLLVIDELTTFSLKSHSYWAEERAANKDLPARAPIWNDIAETACEAAEANMNIIIMGQRLTSGMLKDALGVFNIKMLAGFTDNDYKRLVNVNPVQRSQRPRGRWLYYDGDDPEWLQTTRAEGSELRAWALDGLSQNPSHQGRNVAGATCDTAAPVVGLAAGAAIAGMSYDQFRKRLERGGRPAGEFRIGNQPAWYREHLQAWADLERV